MAWCCHMVTSGSILAQVMTCCLMAPSHYLNQYWLVISKVLWHSSEGNFTGNTWDIYRWYEFENYQFKITAAFRRDKWVFPFTLLLSMSDPKLNFSYIQTCSVASNFARHAYELNTWYLLRYYTFKIIITSSRLQLVNLTKSDQQLLYRVNIFVLPEQSVDQTLHWPVKLDVSLVIWLQCFLLAAFFNKRRRLDCQRWIFCFNCV